MQETAQHLRPLKARYPLLLLLIGWVCSATSIWVDGHYVSDLLAACRDSPGIPFTGVVAGWAGLVLGVLSTIWVSWQLITIARKRALPVTWTNGSLFAVVPVMLLALPVQVIAVRSAMDDTGHHRTHCMGAGPIPGPAGVTSPPRP